MSQFSELASIIEGLDQRHIAKQTASFTVTVNTPDWKISCVFVIIVGSKSGFATVRRIYNQVLSQFDGMLPFHMQVRPHQKRLARRALFRAFKASLSEGIGCDVTVDSDRACMDRASTYWPSITRSYVKPLVLRAYANGCISNAPSVLERIRENLLTSYQLVWYFYDTKLVDENEASYIDVINIDTAYVAASY